MIFVDTGAFVARYMARDEHHEDALVGFALLERDRVPAATSIHVLDETITLLARWAGGGFAAERARAIFASRALQVWRPTEDHEVEALQELERFADQGIGYTDALSFVLMRERDVAEAFTFDRHFQLAGFSLWPAGIS